METRNPLIILAVPIVDTLIVMVKRLRSGRPLLGADNSHIHHHLLGIGFGHKATVIVIYTLSYLLAIVAVSCHRLPAYQQTVLLALVIVALSLLHRVAGGVLLKRMPQLRSNQSLRNTRTYRRLVEYSRYLLVVIKYLVILLLLLAILLPAAAGRDVPVVAGILAALSLVLLFLTNDWGNRFLLFLLFLLYFNGAFLIYQIENYGRQPLLAGLSPNLISHGLFLLLFLFCGVKLVVRRRSGELISSPLEYLLLFVVISVPLLPDDFTGRYHLLTVAAKSVILFTAFRMVLMRQAWRNRKIIVATLLALLMVGAKSLYLTTAADASARTQPISTAEKR